MNTTDAPCSCSTFQSCFIQEGMFWAHNVFLCEQVLRYSLLGAVQYNQPWTVSFGEFPVEQNGVTSFLSLLLSLCSCASCWNIPVHSLNMQTMSRGDFNSAGKPSGSKGCKSHKRMVILLQTIYLLFLLLIYIFLNPCVSQYLTSYPVNYRITDVITSELSSH